MINKQIIIDRNTLNQAVSEYLKDNHPQTCGNFDTIDIINTVCWLLYDRKIESKINE